VAGGQAGGQVRKPARIIIIVEGGVVRQVKGVPKGVIVEVHDYDIESAHLESDDMLRADFQGDIYHLGSWVANGTGGAL